MNGLREKDSGSPCFETLFQEHQDYVAALEKKWCKGVPSASLTEMA